jgi:hypothetical protein
MVIFLHSVSKKEDYILRLIDHHSILTTFSLPYLFKHKPNRYLYMKKLCEKGLVEFKKYPRYKVWYLTQTGKKYVTKKRGRYIDAIRTDKITKNHLAHIVAATNLEIKLDKKYKNTQDISKYSPNRYIKNEQKTLNVVPDCEFTYLGKYNVAFEISVIKKSEKQYYNNFQKYLENEKYHRVYWLYSDLKEKEKIEASFKTAFKKKSAELDENILSKNANAHVFAKFDDILKEGLDSNFVGVKATALTD